MKLFGDFEVVRFFEENLLFVTRDGYIYYIYDCESKNWRKHKNAGNDFITVCNYKEVKREELIDAMQSVFPKKETDFARLCYPSQLSIGNMLDLLKEDYPRYMSDWGIYHTVHRFLLESNICHHSFLKLKELFTDALVRSKNKEAVHVEIKKLSFAVIGKDIFKREIGIVDGHDGSSYFGIMPARILDDTNTDDPNAVAEMKSCEISIEESDVDQYLRPFLYKHFDDTLDANQKRVEDFWEDDDGNKEISYVSGFEWFLTYNFYSFDAMRNILKDMKDTADALASGRNNEFTEKLKANLGLATDDLIADFYNRFIYRVEYMLKVGKENGYDLISVMGP